YPSWHHRFVHSFPTRRSSDLDYGSASGKSEGWLGTGGRRRRSTREGLPPPRRGARGAAGTFRPFCRPIRSPCLITSRSTSRARRSEEHTSELQSTDHIVCRLL